MPKTTLRDAFPAPTPPAPAASPNLHHNPRHHQRHRARAGADEPESRRS